MPRYALLISNAFNGRLETLPAQPSDITHKNVKWRPCPPVAPPIIDPKTQKTTGPTYTVAGDLSTVTEVWATVALTAQEISDAKDSAVSGINGSTYGAQAQILLSVVNDNRELRAKVNALIDATGQAATVTKYAAGQVSVINMTQLKTAIKALLS
jgi:hypothetical protein